MKVERTRLCSFSSAFIEALTSHSPYFTLSELDLETPLLQGWCVLQMMGGAPFIVTYSRLLVESSLVHEVGRQLNVHAKRRLQRLTCGAVGPPLGRPAWGLGHLALTFWGMTVICFRMSV